MAYKYFDTCLPATAHNLPLGEVLRNYFVHICINYCIKKQTFDFKKHA